MNWKHQFDDPSRCRTVASSSLLKDAGAYLIEPDFDWDKRGRA
jgi:hypothetical protein